MKLAVTVNLGNYENLRIESGEHSTIEECRDEIANALSRFGKEPRVMDFVKRVL